MFTTIFHDFIQKKRQLIIEYNFWCFSTKIPVLARSKQTKKCRLGSNAWQKSLYSSAFFFCGYFEIFQMFCDAFGFSEWWQNDFFMWVFVWTSKFEFPPFNCDFQLHLFQSSRQFFIQKLYCVTLFQTALFQASSIFRV